MLKLLLRVPKKIRENNWPQLECFRPNARRRNNGSLMRSGMYSDARHNTVLMKFIRSSYHQATIIAEFEAAARWTPEAHCVRPRERIYRRATVSSCMH